MDNRLSKTERKLDLCKAAERLGRGISQPRETARFGRNTPFVALILIYK
jgi:hypothetical protein